MSIEVKNLTKKFGKTEACKNLNFEIKENAVTVLLGPNGAGKSTLIKAIIGFLRHDGVITADGIFERTINYKKLIGYVPEIPALYPNLTVAEHLEYVARAYKLKDYKEYAETLIDRFELSDKKKKFGDELSKGMQQKVNICCGVLPRPKYIFFDEPMVGLDPHAIKEIKQLITEMRSSGNGVFISTHMIDSVDTLWDNALIMKDGEILAAVTRAEVESGDETLEDMFFRLTEGEEK